MTDLIARLREEAFVRREYYPATADLLMEAATEIEALAKEGDAAHEAAVAYQDELAALRAHPALTSWDSPDALRTRIHILTQPMLSVVDNIDSPQEPLK